MSGIWKILRLVSFILGAVLQAEEESGDRTGGAKKAGVLNLVKPEVQNLFNVGGFDLDRLLELVGELVDTIVAIANMLGIFTRSTP